MSSSAFDPLVAKLAPSYCDYFWYEQPADHHLVYQYSLSNDFNLTQIGNELKKMLDSKSEWQVQFYENHHQLYYQAVQTDFELMILECDHTRRPQLIDEFIQRTFDLKQAPLYRFGLFTTEEDTQLILVFHPMIMTLALKPSRPNANPDHAEALQNFCATQFCDVQERIDIPLMPAKSPLQNAIHRFEIPLTHSVLQYLTHDNNDAFLAVYATWSILFARISRQEDLLLPFQLHAHTENLFFPGHVQIKNHYSFHEVLQLCQQQFQHSQTINNLFSTHEILQELQRHQQFLQSDRFSNIGLSFGITRHTALSLEKLAPYYQPRAYLSGCDLHIEIEQQQQRLIIQFNYKNNCFNPSYMQYLQDYFTRLWHNLFAEPERAIIEHVFMSDTEYQLVTQQFSHADIQYSLTYPDFLHYFYHQVQQQPSAEALYFSGKSFTFRELDELSNTWAQALSHHFYSIYQRPISADDTMLICTEKNWAMVVAILAILKTQAAYIPLASITPEKQLDYIIEDSAAKLIISQQAIIEKRITLQAQAQKLIALETLPEKSDGKTTNNYLTINPSALAYIIYTSGTTGTPKGVMIEHHSVANLIEFYRHEVGINSFDRRLQYSSLNFDASIPDILVTLALGAAIYVISENERLSAEGLYQFMAQHRITTALIPPAMMRLLPKKPLVALRVLESGGEASDAETLQFWAKQTRFLNLYGPTEATVCCTFHYLTQDDSPSCIGRPLTGTHCYVLDEKLQPVPIAVIGELYVSGLGLARGYKDKPELSEKSFIPNPFNHDNHPDFQYLYKTGDLVRWQTDGTLEYCGRNDFQVKIHGFRIELSAIESVLMLHEDIEHAIVIVQEQGNSKHIVAYYVAQDTISSKNLTKWVAQYLPKYMLPSFYIRLDSIPLTINGKVDRKALPKPKSELRQKSYTPPRNETERKIAECFEEVFGMAQISTESNFFSLGGQSLMGIRLCSLITQQLGKTCDIKTLFKYPSIAELSKAIAHQQQAINIPKIADNQPLELSYSQQRLWFIQQYEHRSTTYNIPYIYEIEPAIQISHLQNALNAVVERHPILRTIYREDEQGDVYQIITQETLTIAEFHVSAATLRDYFTQDVQHCFNLSQELPIFAHCYHVNQRRYLVLVIHHIAIDGWSMDILQQEWQAFYRFFAQHETLKLPKIPIRYVDFAKWQKHYLQQELLQDQLAYWRRQLANYETLTLPTDYPRPNQISYHGSYHYFVLPNELTQLAIEFSEKQGCTLYMTLITAFYILLYHYCRQDDLLIASPTSNRHYPQIENIIGCFINTLVLRQTILSQESGIDLLQKVKSTILEAQLNQDIPFEYLVEALNISQDQSRHPLFQVLFTLQTFGEPHLDFGDSKLKSLAVDEYFPLSLYDLSLFIEERNNTLSGTFNFNTALFKTESIQRLAEHYQIILQQFITHAEQPVSRIQFISPAEYQWLIYDCNQTQREYDSQKTLIDLFEENAQQFPNNIALEIKQHHLTYQQLNQQANQLAHYLQQHLGTIAPDTVIGVCLPRSLNLFISLLAILKTGAAYVPLDPNYPTDRLQFMVEDSNAALIISEQTLTAKLHSLPCDPQKIIALDTLNLNSFNHDNLNRVIHPQHLAYIIYTSGSTGKPKGALIEHHSLTDFVTHIIDVFKFHPRARMLQFASINFDASVLEWATTLAHGASLILLAPDELPPQQLITDILRNKKITHTFLPPTLLATAEVCELPDLECLSTGGEACPQELMDKWAARYYYVNGYGPTESTIFSSCKVCKPFERVTIGTPIINRQYYVLNSELQPVPINVAGELCIGGEGLARGYLHRDELTQEKFIPHPFADDPNARLYRSGDLVRRLANGEIDYLGRIDDQVKIRGFRIELGEIEACLQKHPEILQACVAVKLIAGDKQLVAYYVADNSLDTNLLKQFLATQLADYMIPAHFMKIDAIPLSPTGKVNRKALPEPIITAQTEYVAPRNQLETQLCEIWQTLLKVERIGIRDHFFKLGGHSILVLKLCAQIRNQLHKECELKWIFQFPTIEQLAEVLTQQQPLTTIPTVSRQQKLPLSFSQQRLWFIQQYEGQSANYNVPLLFEIRGQVQINYLTRSLHALIARHEVLRTIYRTDEFGNAYQLITHQEISIDEHTINSAVVDDYLQQFFLHHFNLSAELPIKAAIFHVEQRHYFAIVIHHIAIDGWSVDILEREWQAYYHHFAHHAPLELPPLAVQYADFACWQREFFTEERITSQLKFWKQHLQHMETLEFPTDFPRPGLTQFHGETLYLTLPDNLSQALDHFCEQHGVTLYTTLLTAFFVVLHYYSRQTDLVIGSPTANRHYPHIENVLGFFVNTLILRHSLNPNHSLLELLQQITQLVQTTQQYQDVPFERLVDELNIAKDQSRHPIFQILFSVQKFGDAELGFTPGKLHTLNHDRYFPIAKFDLMVMFEKNSDGVVGAFNYSTALFTSKTIHRFMQHFQTLLQHMVSKPQQIIKTLSLLSPAEYQWLIYDCNQTQREYDSQKTLIDLFEENAQQFPNNIALEIKQHHLTYQQLNQQANQLAHYLQQHLGSIAPDTVIGVCLPRSLNLFISLLAILKSGAAYVPLDPNYPTDRLQFMVEDSNAALIISEQTLTAKLHSLPCDPQKIIALDTLNLNSFNHDNLNRVIHPQHLAYIIYTSGSTGKPKGALIEHHSLTDFVTHIIDVFKFHPRARMLQFASINFDASVLEWATTLAHGASLILLAPDELPPQQLITDILRNKKITHTFLPPTLLATAEVCELPDLECLSTGGEACPQELMDKWAARYYYVNGYGPTESTIFSSCKVCKPFERVTIGTPIINRQYYVLNSELQPVPINVAGELCIGGEGLARGYLHRDELTQEKFIPHPFADDPNARLYRSGDLVRRLANGEIDYLGRIDDQVKIRGFRIELGEIEACLQKHPEILQACVAVKLIAGDKQLVAYYVADNSLDTNLLKQFLATQLADYMIPAHFMKIDAIPLSPTGKVNRKALPEPIITAQTEYVAPRNQLETQLCEIWQTLLKVERIGIRDHFFKLGGHSILVLKLCAQIRNQLHKECELKWIFQFPTIEQLAEVLTQQQPLTTIPTVSRQQKLPLSFSQQRLWFIQQYEGQSANYNVPLLFEIRGEIDIDTLKQSLQALVQRHEVLRTIYRTDEFGNAYQLITHQEINVDEHAISSAVFDDYLKKFSLHHFNLSEEIPIKAVIFYVEKRRFFAINIHHIAIDGWSIDIIEREWQAFYQHYTANTALNLSPLPIQYADFAHWQREFLTEERIAAQLKFWKEHLQQVETLQFPTDFPRPLLAQFQGETFYLMLPENLSQALEKFSEQQGVTLYTTLLTAFFILLHYYSRQTDIVIGSPTANRHYPHIENVVGFFVNTLILRQIINPNHSILDLLNQVTQLVQATQQNQDIPFERLVDELNTPKDQSRHPIFQIFFSLQKFGDTTLTFNQGLLSSINIDEYYPVAKLDLSVMFTQQENNLRADINYNTALFTPQTIQRFAQHFHTLLELLPTHWDKPIRNLSLLSPQEYQWLVYDCNQTKTTYPCDKTIVDLFLEQAQQHPHHVALEFMDSKLTYQQLNTTSNQIAHALIHHLRKIPPDAIIAICLPRSPEFFIAILAVLKVGAAYLPLDPHYPLERLQFMLDDSNAITIISKGNIISLIPGLNYDSTKLIALDNMDLSSQACNDIVAKPSPQQLAYIIYTSGSTGKPKGVMIEHRTLTNLVTQIRKPHQLHSAARVLQFASMNFDASVCEWASTFAAGATLIVLSADEMPPHKSITQTIIEKNITHATLPPALLNATDYVDLPNLHCLITAGEACSPELVNTWACNRYYVNGYGPTEATVCVSYQNCQPHQPITIGKPIGNVQLYVLDEQLQPLPINIPGELYIGGECLARGYLHREQLTQEKFIPDPFSQNPHARLYRSGDLVRRLANGDIDYLGRVDDQVKIRGFRIELGEIEACLQQHPDIIQACVAVIVIAGDKQLVAYYVANTLLDPTTLKQFLSLQLADYMVPAHFMKIAAIPLSPTGKVNRKALPEPIISAQTEYIAPRNELETQLTTIWQTLLKVEKVGVSDNFFKLGGHSILVLKLCAQIRNQLHKECELKWIFQFPTIAQLAEVLAQQQATIAIPTISRQQKLQLSFAQQRLWFIQQYEGPSANYNIPLIFEIHGTIELAALKHALQSVVQRHEVLRTLYRADDLGNPYQIITEQNLEIPELTIAAPTLDECLAQFVQHHFILSDELPIKATIFHTPQQSFFVINIHHIAIDGWSIDILEHEWEAYYRHLVEKTPLELPNLTVQYIDFAYWQRNFLTEEHLQTQLNFWKQQLHNIETLLMPADFPRPAFAQFQGNTIYLSLPPSLSNKLEQLSEQNNVTLYTTLLTTFFILLHYYSRQTDIIIGSPTANRHYPQVDNMLGFFINNLILRQQLDPHQSFIDLLQHVNQTVQQAQQHQDIPFERLVDELSLPKDQSRHPLFQILFSLQKFGSNQIHFQQGSLDSLNIDRYFPVAKLDLSVMFTQQENGLQASFNYNTALFTQPTIQRFAQHFHTLLELLPTHWDKPIRNLSLLSPQEYQWLVYDCNQTKTTYPCDKTIVDLFLEQAQQNPYHVALEFMDSKLTYQQLNTTSNQIAHALIHHLRKIPPDAIIAICLPRSPEFFIAILAVLKVGAAYLPLDPHYPLERLQFMLDDSNAITIISKGNIISLIPGLNYDSTKLIALDNMDLSSQACNDIVAKPSPQQLAYIIYTSGSTGKPKGVMIEHRTLTNLVTQIRKPHQLHSAARVLQFASMNFDASVCEWASTFAAGATLIVLSADEMPPHKSITQTIIEKNITHATLPPALLNATDYVDLPNLHCLITAGEACSPELVNTWACNRYYVNGYGPTEATVCVSYQNCQPHQPITIGKPIGNVQLYVLDEQLQPLPINIPGELYIGGECLARGYLHREQLTQEKFIPDPFSQNPHARLYRSGDLVRRLANGDIDYLGRVDDQVKIRGFRIELGEIEACLQQHPDIIQACVNVSNNGADKFLVAYYVSPNNIASEELQSFLRTFLADYMIPDFYMKLAEIPITSNGKVDRKRLPAPDMKSSNTYIAPRNATEEKLCIIFQEVLKLERVGVADNFFRLGGNSLKAIRLLNLIAQQSLPSITLKQLFTHATVEELATLVRGESAVDDRSALHQLIEQDIHLAENYLSSIKITPQKNKVSRILLTGANGFVGIYILQALLQQSKATIYCLIRANNNLEAQQKLQNTLHEYQLSLDLTRINIITGDLSKPQLGLEHAQWHQLQKSIDLIIHNGAYVHHLAPYQTLRETNVLSVVELIKLATVHHAKRLCFISTCSAILPEQQRYPETLPQQSITEMLDQFEAGYVQSKWVAETLLTNARDAGLDLMMIRLGNVTGDSSTGISNYQDNHGWAIFKSCLQLGIKINFPATIEMMPVDYIAKAIGYLSLERHPYDCYNLANPHQIDYATYFSFAEKIFNHSLRQVSLPEWQQLLTTIDATNALYRFREAYLHADFSQTAIPPVYDNTNASEILEKNNIITYPHDYFTLCQLYFNYLIKVGYLT
ncbi:MAG: amino acid adenylation domain-containing protein [Legionellales bacterium]|nr:amino acid adenylation domain-containing protein [Legionellales bacterium]